MKKLKKIIFFIFLCILIFIIYSLFKNNKLTYISLGDSLAKGKNPYGNIDYGYSDYVKDYLENNDKLKYYTKDFAEEGYRITDILNDIELNKKIKIGKNHEGLKTILRRSDFITLSIGSNDIFYKTNNNLINVNENELNKYIDELIEDYDKLLNELTKYFKGNLIIIGYYNPYNNISSESSRTVESSILYINDYMEKLANKYNAEYINIYEIFRENPEYLPNNNDIHPSKEGYKQIANLIIDKIK